jgi:hypothetical protein
VCHTAPIERFSGKTPRSLCDHLASAGADVATSAKSNVSPSAAVG